MIETPQFGRRAEDYRVHRAGFPSSLFERLTALGIGSEGQEIIDLGTGTGSLARGFARRGCRVIGIDPDFRMLEQARLLDHEAGVRIDYRQGRAEQTGLAEHSADVVGAGQCWHWFDRPAAAAEVARILRPDGHVLIAHFNWVPMPGNVVELTEHLIETHNPNWKYGGHIGVHPRWLRDLGEAGYRELESFSYDVSTPYTHEGWRGRIRASAGVGGTLDEPQVAAFDQALEALLASDFPDEMLDIPHRVFAVIGRPPLQDH